MMEFDTKWKLLARLPSKRVDYALAAVGNSHLAIVGGKDPATETSLDRVDVWNTRTREWTHHVMLERRRSCAAVATKDGKQLYVFGGEDDRGRDLSSCEVVDLSSTVGEVDDFDNSPLSATNNEKITLPTPKSLSCLLPQMREARYGCCAVFLPSSSRPEVDIFGEGSGQFISGNVIGEDRGDEDFDRYIVVLGGYNNGRTLASVELFDIKKNSWSTMPSMIDARQVFAAAASTSGSCVMVAGGYNAENRLCTAEIYDTSKRTWRRVSDMSIGRELLGGIAICPSSLSTSGDRDNNTTISGDDGSDGKSSNIRMVVAGGRDQSKRKLAVVEMYDSATDSWTSLPSMRCVAGASRLAMLYGQQLVVAGNTELECLGVIVRSMSDPEFVRRMCTAKNNPLLSLAKLHATSGNNHQNQHHDLLTELGTIGTTLGTLPQLPFYCTQIRVMWCLGLLSSDQYQSLLFDALERCARFCTSSQHLAHYASAVEKAHNDGIIDDFETKTLKIKAAVVEFVDGDVGNNILDDNASSWLHSNDSNGVGSCCALLCDQRMMFEAHQRRANISKNRMELIYGAILKVQVLARSIKKLRASQQQQQLNNHKNNKIHPGGCLNVEGAIVAGRCSAGDSVGGHSTNDVSAVDHSPQQRQKLVELCVQFCSAVFNAMALGFVTTSSAWPGCMGNLVVSQIVDYSDVEHIRRVIRSNVVATTATATTATVTTMQQTSRIQHPSNSCSPFDGMQSSFERGLDVAQHFDVDTFMKAVREGDSILLITAAAQLLSSAFCSNGSGKDSSNSSIQTKSTSTSAVSKQQRCGNSGTYYDENATATTHSVSTSSTAMTPLPLAPTRSSPPIQPFTVVNTNVKANGNSNADSKRAALVARAKLAAAAATQQQLQLQQTTGAGKIYNNYTYTPYPYSNTAAAQVRSCSDGSQILRDLGCSGQEFAPRLYGTEHNIDLFAAIYLGNMDDFNDAFIDKPSMNLNHVDSMGRSAVDFAAIMGEHEMLELLIQKGGTSMLKSEPVMRSLARKRAEAKGKVAL